ncbi:MAG: TIGR02594 family protein [Hyphomicrobiaceae bacterium]
MSRMSRIASVQPAWMAFAWSELGQSESAGAAANARIREFFQDAGFPEVAGDEVAWCAAFVGACLERAGIAASGSLMARSYLSWGEDLAEPRLGCVAVFSRGANPELGHVALWLGETANSVIVLGGNQSDAVTVEAIDRSRLLGLRWPNAGTRPGPCFENEAVFELALTHVLDVEGGYSDDPHDPGGPTNKGITLADYARFKRSEPDAALVAALKKISDTEVREIYAAFYWRPSRSGELSPALALMHFDASVNHGLGASARFLQRAVGAEVDGEIGPLTLAAAARADVGAAVERYAEFRRERYRALAHFWRFGRGWLRRVDIILGAARSLIDTSHQVTLPTRKGDDMSNDKGASAQQTDPQVETKSWGQSMTIWGVIVTSLSTVLPLIAPMFGIQITPDVVHQLGDQTLQVLQALGALIGTLMTVYGRARAVMPLTGKLQLRPIRRK